MAGLKPATRVDLFLNPHILSTELHKSPILRDNRELISVVLYQLSYGVSLRIFYSPHIFNTANIQTIFQLSKYFEGNLLYRVQGLFYVWKPWSFFIYMLTKCVCCVLSHSVISDSLQPYGLWPARFLCPWDSPGKDTGVGCHFLLQGIFLTQGANLSLLHWQADSLPLSQQGRRTM